MPRRTSIGLWSIMGRGNRDWDYKIARREELSGDGWFFSFDRLWDRDLWMCNAESSMHRKG